MRNKIKLILISCLIFAALVLMVACSSNPSPFGDLNRDGYTVSVKFDANGGVFTTNTDTIIDSYKLSGYKTNANGEKELKLFAPDASERGNQAYTATYDNYYLAGWYTERTEVKDINGEITGYTYGGLWNFTDDRLRIDADKEYDANTPVITLYAAWVPALTYEFYEFDASGKPVSLGNISGNPFKDTSITMPAYDEATGKLGISSSFPTLEGKTYGKIYLDENKDLEITGDKIDHRGEFIAESATLKDPVMKIYCETTDGTMYKITTVDQLIKSPDLKGHYIIENDLDFNGKAWPALFLSNDFAGKIVGNGHTIKNVTVTQNNTSNKTFGLFGKLTASAAVSDLTFENINVTIKGFSNSQNATFGILAGEIEDGASLSSVVLKNSELVIEKNTTLMVAVNSRAPKFGLVCADGDITGVTFSGENVKATLSGNDATVYSYTPDEFGQFSITVAEN